MPDFCCTNPNPLISNLFWAVPKLQIKHCYMLCSRIFLQTSLIVEYVRINLVLFLFTWWVLYPTWQLDTRVVGRTQSFFTRTYCAYLYAICAQWNQYNLPMKVIYLFNIKYIFHYPLVLPYHPTWACLRVNPHWNPLRCNPKRGFLGVRPGPHLGYLRLSFH